MTAQHRTPRVLSAFVRPAFTLLLATLTLSLPLSSHADPICARVKIEIKQELSLERQGFDAMMKITNGLDTTTLENVNFQNRAPIYSLVNQTHTLNNQ